MALLLNGTFPQRHFCINTLLLKFTFVQKHLLNVSFAQKHLLKFTFSQMHFVSMSLLLDGTFVQEHFCSKEVLLKRTLAKTLLRTFAERPICSKALSSMTCSLNWNLPNSTCSTQLGAKYCPFFWIFIIWYFTYRKENILMDFSRSRKSYVEVQHLNRRSETFHIETWKCCSSLL